MALFLQPNISLIQKGKLISDGLLCACPMNESGGATVTDVSGEGRDGTWAGGTAADFARVATDVGGGLQFTAANSDYIDFGAQTFGNTSVGSICLFASFGTIVGGDGSYIFGIGSPDVALPGLFGFRAILDGSNTVIHIATSYEGVNHLEIQKSAPVSLANQGWKHLCIRGDGTARTLWLDGVQITMSTLAPFSADSGSWINAANITNPRAAIGASRYDGALTAFVNAAYADFRVYNRPLDQAEIALIAAGLG